MLIVCNYSLLWFIVVDNTINSYACDIIHFCDIYVVVEERLVGSYI
jgi:hypothetical protein